MKIRQYHDFDFMFTVQTEKPKDEVTAAELRMALLKRVRGLSDQELTEACGWTGTYDDTDLQLNS